MKLPITIYDVSVGPLIALLTDFGTRDPYVAAMKAVIASRCDAPIVDWTHEIPPFDVFEAAYFLQGMVDYLEGRKFVVVAVVDPGVGTSRRILALERGGHIFLAPDNGLLSLIAGPNATVVAVEDESLFLPAGSATFHGRDRFAPLAAAVAKGKEIRTLGPQIAAGELVRLDYAPPRTSNGVTSGRVVTIDRFGNAVTDIRADGLTQGMVTVRGQKIDRFAATYDEGKRSGGPFVITGSRGTLEISVAGGDAANLLHIARFDPVEFRRRKE